MKFESQDKIHSVQSSLSTGHNSMIRDDTLKDTSQIGDIIAVLRLYWRAVWGRVSRFMRQVRIEREGDQVKERISTLSLDYSAIL